MKIRLMYYIIVIFTEVINKSMLFFNITTEFIVNTEILKFVRGIAYKSHECTNWATINRQIYFF